MSTVSSDSAAMSPSMATAWIQTFSGVAFYPLSPRIEDIRIEDIAHGLAGDYRFGRQMRQRYTTAQHSVFVSYFCPDYPLHGLLHDGSEAYLVDVPRPVKHLPAMKPYRDAETDIQALVYRRFGLTDTEPAAVKQADNLMLGIEARDLMQPLTNPEEWAWCVDPVIDNQFRVSRCWTPEEAEERFLCRFYQLIGIYGLDTGVLPNSYGTDTNHQVFGIGSVLHAQYYAGNTHQHQIYINPYSPLFSVQNAAAILGRHAAEKRRSKCASTGPENLFTKESV